MSIFSSYCSFFWKLTPNKNFTENSDEKRKSLNSKYSAEKTKEYEHEKNYNNNN